MSFYLTGRRDWTVIFSGFFDSYRAPSKSPSCSLIDYFAILLYFFSFLFVIIPLSYFRPTFVVVVFLINEYCTQVAVRYVWPSKVEGMY